MGDLDGVTFLVTGANTGIGRSTALELARRGGRVRIATRSLDRTREVLDEIAALPDGGTAEHVPLDLADLASVARCAETVRAGEPVDVLVNNAGLAGQRGQTSQGFELAFGVNHLGHFLLTTLLLDHLRAGERGPARVVNVSSDSHYRAKGIDWEAVRRPTRTITGMREYSVSKLCNVLFTQELARRVDADRIATYAVHPGVIASDIWRRVPWPIRPLMTRAMRTTEEGAETSVHCATDPALRHETGRYYESCQARDPNEAATPELAAELWTRSEEWTAANR